MIIELVEEAVEIKIHYENFTGILQSDYEFGYALGKMMRILNLPMLEQEFDLDEIKEKVEQEMETYEPADCIEVNLKRLIKLYRIQHQKGKEVYELYRIGYQKK